MKLFYPLLLLCYISGYTQVSYEHARHDKRKFSKRGIAQVVHYKGKDGRSGRNDLNLLLHWSNGTPGKVGGTGPCLEVKVYGISSGDSAILFVVVQNFDDAGTDHFYVDPRRGKITIYSDGGNGGQGGYRDDGSFRNGYDGGNGGLGGTIDITFDPTALPYVDCGCVIGLNPGGAGGSGGGSASDAEHGGGGRGWVGMPAMPGPAVYIRDVDGKVLKLVTALKD